MAGNSEKKEQKKKIKFLTYVGYAIAFVNCVYVLTVLYGKYVNETNIEKWDTFSMIIMNCINAVCFYLFNNFLNTMFYDYIMDFFCLNLAAIFLKGFIIKYWAVYLMVPAYLCYKLGLYAYEHVKNLDKTINEEKVLAQSQKGKTEKEKKEKTKTKIIKN